MEKIQTYDDTQNPDENIEEVQNESTNNLEKSLDIKEITDSFFDVFLVENILVSYEKDMLNLGFTQENLAEFLSEINNLTIEDQKQIFSFPYEQRMVFFKNKVSEINNGETSIKQFTEELLDFAKERGFTIGFHTAPRKIEKIINRDKRETWSIKGTQKDHRDSDISMAYYSKQYRHLYGHKTYEYIYVVRAAPDHRTDGNWFRAPSLSIVSEIKVNPHTLQDKIQTEIVAKKEETHRVIDASQAA